MESDSTIAQLSIIVYFNFCNSVQVWLFAAAPPMNRSQMLFKSRLVFEVHVAAVALVGPVPAVDVEVILQRALGCEGLQAHHALEGPDPHVPPDVPVEILFLCKGFATLQAQEEFVHFQMSEIVLEVQKAPGTLWTLVPP